MQRSAPSASGAWQAAGSLPRALAATWTAASACRVSILLGCPPPPLCTDCTHCTPTQPTSYPPSPPSAPPQAATCSSSAAPRLRPGPATPTHPSTSTTTTTTPTQWPSTGALMQARTHACTHASLGACTHNTCSSAGAAADRLGLVWGLGAGARDFSAAATQQLCPMIFSQLTCRSVHGCAPPAACCLLPAG